VNEVIQWDKSVLKPQFKVVMSIDDEASAEAKEFFANDVFKGMKVDMESKNAPIQITEVKKLLVKDNDNHVMCLSNRPWFKTPEWEQYPRILWVAFLARSKLATNQEIELERIGLGGAGECLLSLQRTAE